MKPYKEDICGNSTTERNVLLVFHADKFIEATRILNADLKESLTSSKTKNGAIKNAWGRLSSKAGARPWY
ncbi:hypothetical protein Mapa_016612 [Marchantia paleacea]|nr:hypothetical protein Mapa_016612 [Marchantia paleacea]